MDREKDGAESMRCARMWGWDGMRDRPGRGERQRRRERRGDEGQEAKEPGKGGGETETDRETETVAKADQLGRGGGGRGRGRDERAEGRANRRQIRNKEPGHNTRRPRPDAINKIKLERCLHVHQGQGRAGRPTLAAPRPPFVRQTAAWSATAFTAWEPIFESSVILPSERRATSDNFRGRGSPSAPPTQPPCQASLIVVNLILSGLNQ